MCFQSNDDDFGRLLESYTRRHMDLIPSEIPHREVYNLLLNTVAPRPIAWVSSMSVAGELNLAPFSFFNVVSANPPMLGFSPGRRAPKQRAAANEPSPAEPKDTLRNVRETQEFVVNIVTFELAEAMNLTSGEYDPSVDEFEIANLEWRPSKLVRPRRVAQSPVSFECKLHQILDFNPSPEGSSLVIGKVVCIHIEEQYLKEGRLDRNSLDLIGRMGGMQYTRTTERFEMVRPKVE
jgi:flavin reductase (DIM6/NTAB) family NADH-FMN oxidoreductase RutF